tara:strand:- start:102 stop:425 length:324 start_codon:yes stop_codon:yes gene_type:complete
MAEPEVETPGQNLNDMIKAANNGEPTAFADYFSGAMVDRVNDKVDQIRQVVADKLAGLDPSSTPAMELGPEEQEGEVEASAEDDTTEEEEEQSDEEIETADGTTEED